MVRVRFAPSPTGELHVGGARTALYNYLFARQHQGKFIIRIEDTDRERFVPGSLQRILTDLKWLGLNWEEGPDVGGNYGPYLQSERLSMYKKHAEELVKKQAAYYCFCTNERLETLRKSQEDQNLPTKYDRACFNLASTDINQRLNNGERFVVRLLVPDGQTIFSDTVRGEITVNNHTLDDQILIKSDGFPTYHLANVVDDYLMKISHVIRGEEWLPSTVKHILLYKAFGWPQPQFTHLPNVLNQQRAKLSKRKDGAAVWVQTYREQGYLPEALLNFLALLGWHPQDNKELFTLSELEQSFDIARVQKTGAIFDIKKLNWFNAEYIKSLPTTQLDTLLKPYYLNLWSKNESMTEDTYELTKLLQSRLTTLNDVLTFSKWFFAKSFDLAVDTLIPAKGEKIKTLIALTKIINEWSKIKSWSIENLKLPIENLVASQEFTRTELLWPARVALTYEKQSPDVYEVAQVLGKDESIKRLTKAQEILK